MKKRSDRASTRSRRSAVRPILLVESHPIAREALRVLLESLGYHVVTAAEGDEALRVLRSGIDPCLILLDITLPRRAAYRLRRDLLNDPTLSAIPFVVFSTLYDPRIAAAQLQAQAYFHAPFDVEDLLTVIAGHCRREEAAA